MKLLNTLTAISGFVILALGLAIIYTICLAGCGRPEPRMAHSGPYTGDGTKPLYRVEYTTRNVEQRNGKWHIWNGTSWHPCPQSNDWYTIDQISPTGNTIKRVFPEPSLPGWPGRLLESDSHGHWYEYDPNQS